MGAPKPSFPSRISAWFRANYLTAGVLLLVIGFVLYQRIPPYLEAREFVGRPAPEFSLRDLNNRPIGPAELRGKLVLINFWATWCAPCRLEIPILRSIHEELGGRDFEILAVTDESESVVRAFLKDNPVPYPVLLDQGSAVTRNYGVRVYPTLIFVDKDGRIEDFSHGLSPLLKWKIRWKVTGSPF